MVNIMTDYGRNPSTYWNSHTQSSNNCRNTESHHQLQNNNASKSQITDTVLTYNSWRNYLAEWSSPIKPFNSAYFSFHLRVLSPAKCSKCENHRTGLKESTTYKILKKNMNYKRWNGHINLKNMQFRYTLRHQSLKVQSGTSARNNQRRDQTQ